MQRGVLLFVSVVLLAALCHSLPQQLTPPPRDQPRGWSDPDFKPSLPLPIPQKEVGADKDDYDELHSPYFEPKSNEPLVEIKPQTGSLLSLEEGQDDSAVKQNLPSLAPEKPSIAVTDSSSMAVLAPQTPNPVEYHMPVEKDKAFADRVVSNESLSAVPVVDPLNRDLGGIYPPPVVFSLPEYTHPMEILTPLIDPQPCDSERVLQVSVPAATFDLASNVPSLPRKYGCSDYNDISREKASPAVTWSNVYEDVVDFSLQMIDLGFNCTGTGPTAGRIHWHISGIRKAASVTLQEGASRDSRLLYGGKEESNQWLEEYYGGPCPDQGTTGCFRIKVLAHRANGLCQCGHQDLLFTRPPMPLNVVERTPWTFEQSQLAPPGKTKQ